MCIDQSKWRFRSYTKHVTPATYRDRPREQIDRMTINSDSRYYTDYQPQDLERNVLDHGIYVRSPKAHKVFKVHEFPDHVGASNGQPSRWVKVEVTNGEYHGRPITREQYARWAAQQIPCCR